MGKRLRKGAARVDRRYFHVIAVFVVILLIAGALMVPGAAFADPAPAVENEPHDEPIAPEQGNAVKPKDPTIGQVTPLHKAVRKGRLEDVRSLLDQGAEVNAAIAKRTIRWHRLETPLETAIRNRYVDISKLLIERGANVNARMSNGETLLHLAVRVNDVELVRLLLAGGAHPTTMSRAGLTAAHLAQKLDGKSDKRKALISLLKQAEAKVLQEEPPIVPVTPPSAPLE